jgi:hypothetical protein
MMTREEHIRVRRQQRERIESGEDLGVTVARGMDGMRVKMRIGRDELRPSDEILKDHSPEYATDNKDG